ncbi:MAG: isoprenyl transferase [Ancalomicrobiaceae bacterium]|nr:isoprenyl transferase [Ancalomicrobiaceae bacterium]
MTASPDPSLDAAGGECRSSASEAPVPRHVAIIMDGNGRWAKGHGMPRSEGHRRGVDVVRRIVRRAVSRGVAYLTLFSFSAENWRRPPDEIAYLMGLLKLFIRRDLADLHSSNIRVRVIGGRDDLSADIGGLLMEAETLTRANTGLTLIIAFNYGARQEILRATQAIAAAVARGELAESAIDEATFARHLDTRDFPDPDLVIRTSGEQRLSNFLLWQSAYAELVFVPVLWPDFDEAAFDDALSQYQSRERRFGDVAARNR